MNALLNLKKSLQKITLITLASLSFSCTIDDTIEDTILVEDQLATSQKSSSSVALAIANVSASTTKEEYPASNVLDGSTATRWAGYGTDATFTIELATESIIDYINIAFPSGNSRVYGYIILTSTDNETWTQVKDKQSSGTTTGLEEIDVTNSTGKYIKLVLEGSNYNSWNYMSEIEVYGTPSQITVQPFSSPITNSTNETVATDLTGVDFGNLLVETSWISKDKSNRDTFTASEIDGQEWMDVYNSGEVMLKCLAADSHRTELKEKTGVEASLETYKKMSYTARLTSIPSHGVTIAQIHNRADGIVRPWIRIYVDADRYIKIKATKTTPWDPNGSTYTTYTGPKYTSGNTFSIAITTENGNATFAIETDGNNLNETISPETDWDNYNNSYYLKAGVYTEGEDTQPQMKFSAFSIAY